MTTSAATFTEETIETGTGKIRLRRGGTGAALVVLHHDIGSLGWPSLFDRLAGRFTVYAPDMAGYGESDRPDWARHPRDLAIINNQLLDQLGLHDVTLLGLGFGGWVAAEMATMAQERLRRLILVGAAGILPREGEILDQILLNITAYVKAGFRDEDAFTAHFGAEQAPEMTLGWDLGKEMTARVTWKPYMWSLQLPQLLRGVRTPALVVWGEKDGVVPLDVGRQFAEMLPNSRLEVVTDAGHFVDLERPEHLANLIVTHAES